MLKIILGSDWIANRDAIFDMLGEDVANKRKNRILMVPELTSFNAEMNLCRSAGDTASRYAQVLTFTRLADRVADAADCAVIGCMDNGGRVVAMASAARQLRSKLKAYASAAAKPEFLNTLVEAVDEFKRCRISSADLMFASQRTEGILAQKLEELSLLLETYDMLCSNGKRDPRDQMQWILEHLEDSEFAQEHTFYFDGFPDFTRQQMAIIEHLIQMSPLVVISMTTNEVRSDTTGFEIAGETAFELINCANRAGIAYEVEKVQPYQNPLSGIKQRLLSGNIQAGACDCVKAFRTGSVYQECTAAAQQIIHLVQSGCRYRDIAVVCADADAYKNILEMTFHRCGIPVYLSGTEDILDKPAVSTVLSALDAALDGFEQKDVLRYLRSALSPLSADQYDLLENYVYLWNINGNKWANDWEFHPDGLNGKWTEQERRNLATLNEARRIGIEPLIRLRQQFHQAKNLNDQIIGIYHFFEEISLADRLDSLSAEFEKKGDHTSAQVLNQLWEILLLALEQLYDVLGETVWDTDTFSRLLRLLLSQYDVGTVPLVLDAVTVGSVKAMRCQEAKHLLVLGAVEGALPTYANASGLLSDQERSALRGLGIPVLGGTLDILQAEFSQIYSVFCGAGETISIYCPAGQPSFLYRRLAQMSGGESQPEYYLGPVLTDPMEAGAYLARFNAKDCAATLGLGSYYDAVLEKKQHELGSVDPSNIESLYGNELKLSASQIDRFADCKLSYFLKYGLRAKERKQAGVDPAEFGTYVHYVMENTVRTIMEQGGFKEVSLEHTLETARTFSTAYAREHFSELDTQRLMHLFRRNEQEIAMLVQELWNELRQSDFVPIGFEVGFGDNQQLDPIHISTDRMQAQLRGFVDRIDVWHDEDRNYYRVVDYKTGKKDFDYCDIFNGLGLQMLLYLFALEEDGEELLGKDPIPAGVQYFSARAPMIAADGILTPEEAEAAREKAWKRKGLLLAEDDVLRAMEPTNSPKRLCVSVKKDGSLSGDIATREQFCDLKKYIFKLLKGMINDIASGSITANPYTRGSRHNPCNYCPYSLICHPQFVAQRRDFAAMSAARFWEEIEREMSTNG